MYKNFCWKVHIIEKNMYEIDDAPMCPNCKTIPIIAEEKWDGCSFNCLHCNTNFDYAKIYEIRKSLLNILSSSGLKSFKKIYKKPCMLNYHPKIDTHFSRGKW